MGSGFTRGVGPVPRTFLQMYYVARPIDCGAGLLRCLFGVGGEPSGGGRRRSGAWAIGPGPGTGRAEYLQFARSVRMLLEEMEDE